MEVCQVLNVDVQRSDLYIARCDRENMPPENRPEFNAIVENVWVVSRSVLKCASRSIAAI